MLACFSNRGFCTFGSRYNFANCCLVVLRSFDLVELFLRTLGWQRGAVEVLFSGRFGVAMICLVYIGCDHACVGERIS